jgi:hypothetical protein
MKPSLVFVNHREAIRRVVAAHRASNARVFGSVLHGDDSGDSDLDILVDPTPETTLLDIGAVRHECFRDSRQRSNDRQCAVLNLKHVNLQRYECASLELGMGVRLSVDVWGRHYVGPKT